MKKQLFVFGAAALAMMLFTTGCSWFESGGEADNAKEFYRPRDKQGAGGPGYGGGRGGDADLTGGGQGSFGNGAFDGATANSGLTDGTGMNNYDGFGVPIAEVKFQPVFFALDQFNIGSNEIAKLDVIVAYLNQNPGTGVVIEGNCDNRGSEEYNRALGERRAIASYDYLTASGIDAKRIKTISNGESKPLAMGNDEASHQQNRRDDFIAVKLLHP